MHKTPEHAAWRHMKDRCYNPKSQRYDRYGARGIQVCERWLNSFENFFADLGLRPSAEHSLERIDNDKDYEPSNCKWGTKDEQNSNKSNSRFLVYLGIKKTVAQWAKEVGIGPKTLELRLKAGWTVEESLTRPVEKRRWRGKPGQKLSKKEKQVQILPNKKEDMLPRIKKSRQKKDS